MTFHIQKQSTDKNRVLRKIRRSNQIKQITIIIVIVLLIVFVTSLLQGFINDLRLDLVSAIVNLIFAWNFGLLLFVVIWQLVSIRQINKQLFPELKQFINETELISSDKIEKEIYDKVDTTYKRHKIKLNQYKNLCWKSFGISFMIVIITLVFEFV